MKARLLPAALLCAGLLCLAGCTNRLGDALRAVRVIDPDPGMIGIDNVTGDIAVGVDVYASYCNYADKDLKLAKSTDDGETWPVESRVTVDATGNVGEGSRLFLNGNTVRIIYYENYNLTGQVRKCAESTDGGATWTIFPIDDPPNTGDLQVFSMSFFADILCCFYSMNDAGTRKLLCARSGDRGATWLSQIEIASYGFTNPRTGCAGYSAAVNPAPSTLVFFYSWIDELSVARSTDGGVTWPPGEVRTISPAGERIALGVTAASSGTDVFVVYCDSSNKDVLLLRSANNGQSWPSYSSKVADYVTDIRLKLVEPAAGLLCLFMTTRDSFETTVTTDSGSSWSDLSYQIMEEPRFISGFAVAGTIYVLGAYETNETSKLGLIKSTDGGASWY